MKKLYNLSIAAVMLLATLILPMACNPWSEVEKSVDGQNQKPIMEVLKSMPELSTFAQLLEETHYDQVLDRAQAYTVFAPDNEAWKEIDFSNFDKAEYVRNHIAWQSFPMISDAFSADRIKMINGKYVQVSGKSLGIGQAVVKTANVPSQNGLIHVLGSVVEPQMNIWEYVSTAFPNSLPVALFNASKDSTMDEEKSYLLNLDENGRPVYDTVWKYSNELFDTYPINNEDSLYTFVYIPEDVLDKLRAKYRPYFTVCDFDATSLELVENEAKTSELVDHEILRDLILQHAELSDNQTASSVDGVDVTPGSIDYVYQASNGLVYEVIDFDVRIYENKVRTQILEAEDYYAVHSQHGKDDVSKRVKSWASKGYDIMLACSDYFNNTGTSDNASSQHYTNQYSSCFEYRPLLNSVQYKIFMMSYDDTKGTVKSDTALIMDYKLLASLPSAPVLTWKQSSSVGSFTNNFADTIAFVVSNRMDQWQEQPFTMWATDGSANYYATYQMTEHADYTLDQLPCKSYGEAVLQIANSAFSKSLYTLYLDYIKLVPVIDPDK